MVSKQLINLKLKKCAEVISEKFCASCKSYSTKTYLQHIGTSQASGEEQYKAGQTFVHKILAYRGVVLHPWNVHVYERNSQEASSKKDAEKLLPKLNTDTYYQVLMDSRDLKNNQNILPNDGITFLHKETSDRNKCLYSVPGVDYVSHVDIIPYKSAEDIPVHHDLYNEFLTTDSESKEVKGTEVLENWQKVHQISLEVDKVHKETTKNFRVTVIPFFLGMKQTISTQACDYWWRYTIRIENLSSTPATLRERHWQIVSNGSVKTVRGRGVTGSEPILSEERPVFQFSSHISLQSPNGTVWGSFRLEQEDGKQFEAGIPAFALESKL